MDFEIENAVLKRYTGSDSHVVVPKSVTAIGPGAFRDCIGIRTIALPDSVTHTGDYAFLGCSGLADERGRVIVRGVLYDCLDSDDHIVVPDGVTRIAGYAFLRHKKLRRITLPGSVTGIGEGAFYGCEQLNEIGIPDSVTEIGDKAFCGCRALADDAGRVMVRGVFYGYYGSARDVAVPEGIGCIAENAFFNCKDVESVTLPGSLARIDKGAFSWCVQLQHIAFPGGPVTIGDNAFSDCHSLEHIDLPDGVAQIGEGAFSRCRALEGIGIPGSVKRIGKRAFAWCDSLGYLSLGGAETFIGEEAFKDCRALRCVRLPGGGADLKRILPRTDTAVVIHTANIDDVGDDFKPGAAAGFAEDGRGGADKSGSAYLDYIRNNAPRLCGMAIAHPTLLHLMMRERLIAEKDMDRFMEAAQAGDHTEAVAALLEYGHSLVNDENPWEDFTL